VGAEDRAGDEQPHAPSYQYGLQAHWQSSRGPFARAEVTGVDAFAFSASHTERSVAYQLVNLTLGYRTERWSASLWGRNVFDERYYPRGFFFANEPPEWIDKRYVQNGDPRRFGVSLSFDF
jgi:outer membrane receptor protein involved in Fe transport